MAGLKANAIFTYGIGTANIDGTVTLNLVCAQPGEGFSGSADFHMVLTAAQVVAINSAGTPAQKKTALDAIVVAYMQANYRPTTVIQAALDNLAGMTVLVP